MSETIITVEDAAACLPDLVDRIHSLGEPAVIVKSGRPLVRMVPISRPQSESDLVGFLRQWRTEYPLPDDQFAEAIGESRINVQPPHNPWE